MAEQAMKAIINAEDMANMWRKLLYRDEGKEDNNITLILILASWPDINTIITPEIELEDPKKAQQWRTVDPPEEILHYLTIQNQQHFGQAKGTPFAIPPLLQYFDWSANSPVSEMVLKGYKVIHKKSLNNNEKANYPNGKKVLQLYHWVDT
eukprot:2745419-Ditylum_brightwellii.AAC.1